MSLNLGRESIVDGVRQATLLKLTMEGDIELGGNKLKTTNLLFKEYGSSEFAVRNLADTLYMSLRMATAKVDTSVISLGANKDIDAMDLDNCRVITGIDFTTVKSQRTITSLTLGVGETTFAVTGEVMEITGDAGGNTIATITGGVTGQILVLFFVDSNVTITDDNTHAANTIDLSAAFTSADDAVLVLMFDGTSWYEISRSTN